MAGAHHLVSHPDNRTPRPFSSIRDGTPNLVCSYIICILAATTLYFILRAENNRRESVPGDETERAKLAFMDLTDKENPYFRYVL